MKKKTKIVLGISTATLLVLILTAVYFFFFGHDLLRQWFWMEIHDESRLASFLANIEDNTVVKFPEKIESLKAAERVYTDRGGSCVFVLRFKTDKNGLAQLRESLVLLYDYREYKVVASQYADEIDQRRSQKGTPEWYRAKLPEGVVYSFHGESRFGNFDYVSATWVVLAESEEVIVYMEGVGD